MGKHMLIDAAHPEETRVVVLDGKKVDDFDFEASNRKQLRGNIYLAKVTRVEPSLQAAFVEYGGNRHGFLAFSEIHPDYYQIPVADREALKAEVDAAAAEDDGSEGEDEDEAVEDERRRRILTRRYKIQEVIRRRQIMLIQVVKEERGNKGAALTTYLSLAGRYCVLMPNTGRGGGISRKITNPSDRKRLKKVASDLHVPQGMGLIVRTAGAKRTKTEIRRDYDYLLRAWENIRETTLTSIAPALIYEESSLVKRAIRDLYDKDVEEIYVEGEAAYREAKDFVRMLMPSHARKVHHYKEPAPLFAKHNVERQLESIYSPVVNLKSGGYLVINQTEALVAIDVNSGRATRERNIEATALKTNLEAADEAPRQMRLRDLAGLVVIDFIDMEDSKNDRQVEKRMKDALRNDRARLQVGKISPFGLLELSRQRRRTGILEGSSHVCAQCAGSGRVRSVESSALRMLRALDEDLLRINAAQVEVRAPGEVAFYVLNEKREALARIERDCNVQLRITASSALTPPDYELHVLSERREIGADDEPEAPARERPERERSERERPERERSERERPERERTERERPERERPRRERIVEDEPEEAEELDEETAIEADGEEDRNGRRRRRGRRGGRRRREEDGASAETAAETPRQEEDGDGDRGGRRRRRRRPRGRRLDAAAFDGGEASDFLANDIVLNLLDGQRQAAEESGAEEAIATPAPAPAVAEPEPVSEDRPARRPRNRRAKAAGPAIEEAPPEMAAFSAMGVDEPARAPAIAAEAAAPVPEAVRELPPEPALPAPDMSYEVDAEKREKFFARISRWAKKA
ncbi:MAG: ribonuclease E/G [Hyphomonadaceae bacterium]|nr:ribonuclease E/G [Hyphomonadaceae bacterium]